MSVSDQEIKSLFSMTNQDGIRASVDQTKALAVNYPFVDSIKSKPIDVELTDQELNDLVVVFNLLLIGKGRVKK